MKKPTLHDASKGKRKKKPASASSKKKAPVVRSIAEHKAAAAGLATPSSPVIKGTNARTSKPRREKAGERDGKGKFEKGNGHAWKPGESGNPDGRPKCITLSEAYRKQLAMIDPDDLAGRTFAEIIAERQVRIALGQSLENSTNAAKELCDRTEGKAKQPLELDVKGEARTMLAAFLGVPVDQLPAPAA